MIQGLGESTTDAATDELLHVLDNPTRVAILLALWEAYHPPNRGASLSFSELYEAVDFDGTGNFNYHLEKLLGSLVRRTDDGYALTGPGSHTARTLATGELLDDTTLEFTEIDVGCPVCESRIKFSYAERLFIATCSACPGLWEPEPGRGFVFQCTLPPHGLTKQSPEDVFHRAVTYDLHRFRMFMDGVCPRCAGDVERSVAVCHSHMPESCAPCPHCHHHHQFEVVSTCPHCKGFTQGPLPIAVLALPVVKRQLANHDGASRFACWDTVERAMTVTEAFETRQPLNMAVTVPVADGRVDVVLDADLQVLEWDYSRQD